MIENKLIDDAMTEVTPYKLAVIDLYRKRKTDKDTIEYKVTPEYLNKLKEQLTNFKGVIQKNIDQANEKKEELQKALDAMDKDYYSRLLGDEYDKLDEKDKLDSDAIDKIVDAKTDDGKATESMDSPEDVEKLLVDALEQGYEESHKLYLIEQFIETKNSEMKTMDDMIKEIEEESDNLKNAVITSKLVINMIHDITQDSDMVAKWKEDFAKIQAKSKEDNVEDWITILKYCSMTKAKKEVLELQKKMNETVQKLLTFYKEYVKDSDAKVIETIPEINWYGKDRNARYNEFDGVIQYMRDMLHKVYLENQGGLDNEKLKEIKSLIFSTDQLCLSKELRDTRLIEAFTIPDPVERYAYRVNMLAKPIIETLYTPYIENAYEFGLYTLSIIREPNAFWVIFLLAGEM